MTSIRLRRIRESNPRAFTEQCSAVSAFVTETKLEELAQDARLPEMGDRVAGLAMVA